MSQIGNSFARTTLLLSSDRLLSSFRRTQLDLAQVERAISTGQGINAPSQAPERTAAILILRQQLQAREQYERNLQHALSMLNIGDQALGDANDIMLEARSIAASQIGVTAIPDTRESQATIIDAQIQALLEIVNRQFQGISIFGGNRSAVAGGLVFEEFLGGVRYVGAAGANLNGDYGVAADLSFNSNGHDAFGALSSRVTSVIDLDPQATAGTRISDVNGAQNTPVRLGSVLLTVNAAQVPVDLTTADTLGDVTTRINDAIQSINPSAGSLSISGGGFVLTAGAGFTVSIADISAAQTAGDLGINISSTGGVPAAGADLGARLTRYTLLADLGVAVDFASGLTITQGSQTKVADFSSAATIEDLMNVIDELNLGLRLQINGGATGLNLVNEVSGLALAIGETAGGTTATDLGLRSLGLQTRLDSFRFGLGVESTTGQDDFRVELHDGSSFDVNLDGVGTVSELITAIGAAATAAGLTVGNIGDAGTNINVGLASSGNGLAFEDGTAGGNDFRVLQLNTSLAATHLGIYTNAGAANSITGADQARVRTESLFTDLINLRDALLNNDELGITLAGEGLEQDLESVVRARADLGVRTQRIEQHQQRSAELRITEQAMLSDLQDTDLMEMITRFTQLQQQLAAGLQVGAAGFQLSLLDFLR